MGTIQVQGVSSVIRYACLGLVNFSLVLVNFCLFMLNFGSSAQQLKLTVNIKITKKNVIKMNDIHPTYFDMSWICGPRSGCESVRIAWRDHDQAHELPLGSLHRLLATYPANGLPIVRGLRDWEHGMVCLEVLVTSKQYRAGEWTRMKHVGYTRAENAGVSTRMVAGDWEGEEKVNEVKEENPPRPRTRPKHHPPNPSHQSWWQQSPQNAF